MLRWPARLARALCATRTARVGYVASALLPVVVVLVVQRLGLQAFVFEHLIVLLVVGCAMWWGLRPAVATAVVAVFADNVLLQEPIGRPAISSGRDAIDLALFMAVAVCVGWLVASSRLQRARAEQAAARERRAREDRDWLIATISHDLATPLGAIRGSVQFAQRFGHEARVDFDRLLDRLDTAAMRATSLLETLRDTQALDRGELSLVLAPTDLRALVLPTVRMFDRVSERHPVVMHMPDEPIPVRADAARLQRVLENLLTNAVKYSPAGGAIEVHVAAVDTAAVVSVRDYGIGISPDALPHVFEPSYRAPEAAARTPGLGLGLSIAREIALRHGGTIEVRPAEPVGTIFTLRVPLCPVHEMQAQVPVGHLTSSTPR